jgi:hypothetical protein
MLSVSVSVALFSLPPGAIVGWWWLITPLTPIPIPLMMALPVTAGETATKQKMSSH